MGEAKLAEVRRRGTMRRAALAGLAVAGAAFASMVVLAHVMPDAPPYVLLDAPRAVAGWVDVDRGLLATFCLGLLAAGVCAGVGVQTHRRSAVALFSGLSLIGIGLMALVVLWGTGETAQDQGLLLQWMDTATEVAGVLILLAGCTGAVAGAALIRRTR